MRELGVRARNGGGCGVGTALHARALAAMRRLGDSRGVAVSLGHLGGLARGRGDYDAAWTHHEASLEALAETYAFEEAATPSMGGVGYLVREPVGTVGAIVPWNSSHGLIPHKIGPALLALRAVGIDPDDNSTAIWSSDDPRTWRRETVADRRS